MKDMILHGDCLGLLPTLPNRSVDLVITSPPYAELRKSDYGGIPESLYPQWFTSVMAALRPKLKPHASVFVNIGAHIKDGVVADYVLRTRLALRADRWRELDEFIWVKPDAPPRGRNDRPKRVWESILWYSLTDRPYANLTALRTPVSAATVARAYRAGGRINRNTIPKFTRITNVITVPVGGIRSTGHSAPYPQNLVVPFIKCFSRPNGVVLDMFLGSGTTAIAAKELGRGYIGIERMEKYVDLAENRLREQCRSAG